MRQSRIRSAGLLLFITVLFHWRTLLTRQFSLLTDAESVNQGYAWLIFCINQLRRGALPIWDPYVHGGRSFVGEMQTSGFSPFNLLLALIPFDRHGLLWPQVYHAYVALLHFLGALFMYALARYLRLSRFASLIAAICFSLTGYVSRLPWPDMIQSAILLPLVFLFLLRSLNELGIRPRRAVLNAAFSGLMIGLSVLGGRIHVVMMQGFVVVSAVAFHIWSHRDRTDRHRSPEFNWRGGLLITGVVIAFALGSGAIQLLPSMEYSPRVIRGLGAHSIAAESVIPYAYLSDHFLAPFGFVSLLIPFAFNGNLGPGEHFVPYIGVFPLLLCVVGIWKGWQYCWTRYLFLLALLSLMYAMGPFSGLHGVLYALVPRLWEMREASRLLYLTGFGMALLAGIGADRLLDSAAQQDTWQPLRRVFTWVAIAASVFLGVPAIFNRPDLNYWIALSIVLILLSYGLFRYIIAGHRSSAIKLVVLALIIVDVTPFDWTARNTTELNETGGNYWRRLAGASDAVQFLRKQPGFFRVHIDGPEPPNIGDSYSVFTTGGAGITDVYNFGRIRRRLDLYRAEYIMKPAASADPEPVFSDANWKIFRNPNVYPYGWIVHRVDVEPSKEKAFQYVSDPKTDLHDHAVVSTPLQEKLDSAFTGEPEGVEIREYDSNRIRLSVIAHGRGLLVLSENFYPGWHARVNGQATQVHEVDGALRGVTVPGGKSEVELRYSPASLYVGVFLSVLSFLSPVFLFVLLRRKMRPIPERVTV
jgi:hypothetical protein